MLRQFILFYLFFISNVFTENVNKTNIDRVLSRRKRYLTFPEGSSLQLVYCLTMPIVGHSTIFTIGGTAALAWELPSEPFSKFGKSSEQPLNRVDKPLNELKRQDYLPPSSDKYKITINRPNTLYRPQDIFNSLPVKYNTINFSPAYQQNINRKKYNKYNSYNSSPVISYVDPKYHYEHRRTRRSLYSKIEKFLKAQSKDGHACLLKAVCEVSQAAQGKGSFMEEIIKAIFRVKPYKDYKNEDVYDNAANINHNCTRVYPTCETSVWSLF